jgi:hypothetical protein
MVSVALPIIQNFKMLDYYLQGKVKENKKDKGEKNEYE